MDKQNLRLIFVDFWSPSHAQQVKTRKSTNYMILFSTLDDNLFLEILKKIFEFSYFLMIFQWFSYQFWLKDLASNSSSHRLRTPNEGINRKNLKFWADVADEIWDWGLIFGRAVKAISSPGVRSPWLVIFWFLILYLIKNNV